MTQEQKEMSKTHKGLRPGLLRAYIRESRNYNSYGTIPYIDRRATLFHYGTYDTLALYLFRGQYMAQAVHRINGPKHPLP